MRHAETRFSTDLFLLAVTKSGTGTWDVGRGDAGKWGLGDVGTRGRGDVGTSELGDARGLEDVINK